MILASDLDGTLLQNNTDNMISRKDIDSIRRFRAAGNQFGLVTGRSPKLIANIFRKNPDLECDFNIFCTGALVLDSKGSTLYEQPLPFHTVEQIIQRADEVKADHLLLCDKSSSYAARLGESWFDEIEFFWGREFLDFSPDKIYLHKKILTILLGFEDIPLCEKIYRQLKKEFSGQASFFYNMGGIDICADGVNKSRGLSIIEKYINGKIYTIGDGENDVDMLRTYQGFAIANGCESAKLAANQIVCNVADAIDILIN